MLTDILLVVLTVTSTLVAIRYRGRWLTEQRIRRRLSQELARFHEQWAVDQNTWREREERWREQLVLLEKSLRQPGGDSADQADDYRR